MNGSCTLYLVSDRIDQVVFGLARGLSSPFGFGFSLYIFYLPKK